MAADLSVLRTIDPCIDPTDAQGMHPSDAGRTCAGLALWGGEAYVLDHPSEALAVCAFRSSIHSPPCQL